MLLHFFHPHRCPICNRENARPGPCMECLPEEPLSLEGRCHRCFTSLQDGPCPICSTRNMLFDRHISTFGLNTETKRVLQAWKFENDRHSFRTFLPFLRSRLTGLLEEEDIIDLPGLIVYIGSGASSRNIRNYQPVQDLAHELGMETLEVRGILRKKVSRKQSGMDRKNRFLQVLDSIQLTEEYRPAYYYVILEDLFTTGATANEASRILKRQSQAPVYVLSLFMAD